MAKPSIDIRLMRALLWLMDVHEFAALLKNNHLDAKSYEEAAEIMAEKLFELAGTRDPDDIEFTEEEIKEKSVKYANRPTDPH